MRPLPGACPSRLNAREENDVDFHPAGKQSSGSRFKTILWVSLGLTALFVFITSEVLLVTDYPMYHAYRLQVIADRGLLIPHTLCGTFALLAGPSSSRRVSGSAT